jgi:hypothetical protein
VSLRTDIHTAYDVITPDTGGMAERVVETARRQAPALPRRRKFMFGMRAPLPLVAALLAVAIVAAVLVGGRLWWNTTHGISPAGGATLPTLAELEARPWQHQLLAPSETCIDSPFSGPVSAYSDSETVSKWGVYSGGHFVLARGFSGLLMVRARDARSGKKFIFANEHARGDVVGTDTVDGLPVDQHPEAVFEYSDPAIKADSTGQKTFRMTIGAGHPFSGCFQWQVDGTYNGKPFGQDSYFSGPPG